MNIDFDKLNGLVPAIIQDDASGRVLMLGFMNREALEHTRESKRVTFYSRSKQRLWTKGESSGNFLEVREIFIDCDNDTLLVKAKPSGPVCHTGSETCFKDDQFSSIGFLSELEKIITERKISPRQGSYTSRLFGEGIERIAQKVGEEAVETVIAAMRGDGSLKDECADLVYHLMVLLAQQGLSFAEVIDVLKKRHR